MNAAQPSRRSGAPAAADAAPRARQAEISHLGQVGSLPAQQVLKVPISFGEVINELGHFLLLVLLFAVRDVVFTRDSTVLAKRLRQGTQPQPRACVSDM